MPTSPERNEALQKVVDETGSPHWLGAHNSMHGDTNSHRPPRIEKPDFKEAHVDWLETGANGVGHFHGKKHLEYKNWDTSKGEPDDADGKEHPEECVFVGPNGDHRALCTFIPSCPFTPFRMGFRPSGKWYDFACEPKNPKKRFHKATGKAQRFGPVLQWPGASEESMHRIFPMCQMVIHGTDPEEMAVGWLDPEDVMEGKVEST